MRSHVSRYPTPAHTYYVDDTNGLDANRGNSEDAPWQTISKVNAVSLKPGDRLLFKRGETWAGKLIPAVYGSPSRYIIYGAYGAGDLPIIDGSSSVGALFINTSYHYLRYENIDFSGSTGTTYGTVTCQSSYIYFYNCIFRDSADQYGLAAYDWVASGSVVHDITVDTCQAYNNSMTGITFGSGLGTLGPRDILIKNCISHDNGTTLYLDHGIYLRHGGTIENCICYGNDVGSGIKVNCEGVTDSPYTPIVRNNICYDNFMGIVAENANSIIYNNLLYANTHSAIELAPDSVGTLFYFNTLVNATSGSDGLITFASGTADVTIKNNLLIQDAAVANVRIFRTYSTGTIAAFGAANDIDYNLYYHDATGSGGVGYDSGGERDWAYWTATGAEPNGTILSSLPDFVTRYTNLHPADGGNLKALGVDIIGYESDMDGNSRADPPTQGCYEEASA